MGLLDRPAASFGAGLVLALVEARPVVQGIFVIRFAVGVVLSAPPRRAISMAAVTGLVAWFFVVWGTYLLNGLSDVEGDRLNGSYRPLARGDLDCRFARNVVVVLFAASLALASRVNPAFVSIDVMMMVSGVLYSVGSFPLKNHAVTASVVVTAGGMLTYLGGAVAAGHPPLIALTSFAGVMSLFMGVAGNTKDFGDTAGDRQSRRRTLPIVLGPRGAAWVIATMLGLLSLLTLLVAWTVPVDRPLLLVVPAAVFLIVSMLQTAGAPDRRRRRVPYKAFMLAQYVVNVLMLVELLAVSGSR